MRNLALDSLAQLIVECGEGSVSGVESITAVAEFGGSLGLACMRPISVER